MNLEGENIIQPRTCGFPTFTLSLHSSLVAHMRCCLLLNHKRATADRMPAQCLHCPGRISHRQTLSHQHQANLPVRKSALIRNHSIDMPHAHFFNRLNSAQFAYLDEEPSQEYVPFSSYISSRSFSLEELPGLSLSFMLLTVFRSTVLSFCRTTFH